MSTPQVGERYIANSGDPFDENVWEVTGVKEGWCQFGLVLPTGLGISSAKISMPIPVFISGYRLQPLAK